jgi:transposase
MTATLLPDPLWDLVEPFLPSPPQRPQGGRPRVLERACLTGIVFVLRSGIPWQMLPQELGCGSGMTCWRRLRDWQQAGVWDLIHFALLDWLARDDQHEAFLSLGCAVLCWQSLRRDLEDRLTGWPFHRRPSPGLPEGRPRGSVYTTTFLATCRLVADAWDEILCGHRPRLSIEAAIVARIAA